MGTGEVGSKFSWEQVKLGTSWEQNKMGPSWDQVGNELGTSWEQVGNKLGTSWEQVWGRLGTSYVLIGGLASPLIRQEGVQGASHYGLNGLNDLRSSLF